MEDNQMSVFKSYLRRLLQDLKDVDEKTPDMKETKEAKEMLKKLKDKTERKLESPIGPR